MTTSEKVAGIGDETPVKVEKKSVEEVKARLAQLQRQLSEAGSHMNRHQRRAAEKMAKKMRKKRDRRKAG